MTDINNFAQLYSELSLNPDLPTLAERCKLLTEILLEDTETKCDYCRALNHVLLVSHFDRDMLPHLTGLLHDMAHSMAGDLIAPVQPWMTIHLPTQQH
ncbi:hypothetical protein D4N07_17750 [Enterobacter hormaechei]|uniref:hypothetical protein n=1 Tax=Enterobacter hormaechei TaxID=158836 RepID=UPI0011DDD485|nr:hypothetical protein [Enterobacter hormaechei]TXU01790.1 hypothetical protein D4N07_17750 [Enterobacter hormaechei]